MIDKKGNRGTTIMDLMIVVSVIGILTAVGAPNLSNWLERSRQKEASYELASVIRLARAQALELGNKIGVKLSIGGETDIDGDGEDEDYILFVDSDSGNDYTAGERILYRNEWGRGASIDASSGGNIIVYKPSGLLLQGNTTIDIDNYHLKIQPRTGRVIVYENND